MSRRQSELLVPSLRLLTVLFPRHRFGPPRPEQPERYSPSPEAPPAWPTELGLMAVETFVDTARQRRPAVSSTTMGPSMRATMRMRGTAQRSRARELGLTPERAPRASGVDFSSAPMLLVHGALALVAKRRGLKQLPVLGWRLVFLGKLIGELDRRRSWRQAGGASA